jgi:Uma2 family endonuclease
MPFAEGRHQTESVEGGKAMSTVLEPVRKMATIAVPALRNGDHLDQRTFHERYLTMPQGFRAELIGGVVHVPSPTTNYHAVYHSKVNYWLEHYSTHTPGTEAMDNGTVVLDEENEPQPDGVLRILDSSGGASRVNPEGYVEGVPELHAEVAYSSAAIDLFEKHDEYAAAGVREYVVVLIAEQAIRCFRLQDGEYVDFPPDADGIWRSQAFPGLWLNVDALLRLDGVALIESLEAGFKTPDHAAFTRRLQGGSPTG